jgi:predicted nucleic acid-binding protein
VIIADSTLIAYLLIPGAIPQPVARAVLRKDSTWAAPALWRSEFRNIVWQYVRRQSMSLSDGLLIVQKAESLISRDFEVDAHAVLVLAVQSGCTTYDCEFVYCAQKHGVPLVTSDKKVLHNFPGIAVSPEDFTR